jgi:hypothetical protein
MLPVFLTKSPSHRSDDEAYFFKKSTQKETFARGSFGKRYKYEITRKLLSQIPVASYQHPWTRQYKGRAMAADPALCVSAGLSLSCSF